MRALAYFGDEQSPIQGHVLFTQPCACRPVQVTFQLHSTLGKGVHAVHIHEWGDLSDGCTSLGAHYNPSGETHGSIFVQGRPRHAGDLINNLDFDQNGDFVFSYMDDMLTLFGDDTIYGRSVVIHETRDDLGLGKGRARAESLKTGNAGKRIACAIIAKIADL